MATMVTLDDDIQARLDAMVSAGRFASREEAVRASVILMDEDILDAALTPDDIAAIRAGLADEAAGRLIDAEEVFADLRARFGTH